MKLVLIPDGEFLMGSPKSDPDHYDDEGPQHRVTISKPFYMGVYEVTQAQWRSVMGTEPWKGKHWTRPGDNNAASHINWIQAGRFCRILSKKIGRTVALPTEAQWEYACRAGSKAAYRLGDYAWYDRNAYATGEKYAHAVGQKLPNAFGLYDTRGNVWEWCRDWYDKAFYAKSNKVDPENTTVSRARVLRGGSWCSDEEYCRSAYRYRFAPSCRNNYPYGFRVVVASDSGAGDARQAARRRQAAAAGALNTKVNTALDLGKGVTMKLTLIPAGKFLMGSPKTEIGRYDDEGPQRQVTISKPFYMGACEVTQAQWRAVMGAEPWDGGEWAKSGDNLAASYITWDLANKFCKTVSKKIARTVALPTEAQWEYACCAGAETAFSYGDDASTLGNYAWYKANAWDKDEMYPHAVGQKKPNAWGLHDMHGNVWEWCRDWYDAKFYAIAKNAKNVDPENTALATERVCRGGSWFSDSRRCRTAFRDWSAADPRSRFYGLRVVVSTGGAD
jgi:formylglycine-generating enzyme required for sulfatase activity